MGYSFYDITYKDRNNATQELRIFFKGELKTGEHKCKLTITKKNLNFLEKK